MARLSLVLCCRRVTGPGKERMGIILNSMVLFFFISRTTSILFSTMVICQFAQFDRENATHICSKIPFHLYVKIFA